jgi:LuxR family transcriptional regulator
MSRWLDRFSLGRIAAPPHPIAAAPGEARPVTLGCKPLNRCGIKRHHPFVRRAISLHLHGRIFSTLKQQNRTKGLKRHGGSMGSVSLENLRRYSHQQPLTTREVEILKWSAEGKTAADIAIILSMKERTVHFHVANAIQKMGATNKTSAVVQAALSGMF